MTTVKINWYLSRNLTKMIDKCPKCKGEMKYYQGILGYESFQCVKCGYDINDKEPIIPSFPVGQNKDLSLNEVTR